jgi:hypothetical protein
MIPLSASRFMCIHARICSWASQSVRILRSRRRCSILALSWEDLAGDSVDLGRHRFSYDLYRYLIRRLELAEFQELRRQCLSWRFLIKLGL